MAEDAARLLEVHGQQGGVPLVLFDEVRLRLHAYASVLWNEARMPVL